jgi:hypothetical protein
MTEVRSGTQRMEMLSRFARLALPVACAIASCAVLVPRAWAQIGTYGTPGLNLDTTHAPPIDTAHPVDLRQEMRDQAKEALILGDWLIFPTAFVGGIYDTNPTQAASGATASEGLRLSLSGSARRYGDFDKTDLYGMVDGRLYTNGAASVSDITTAKAGGIETYSPLEDWTFRGQGDFTRQRDIFDTLGVNHTVTSLNTTGVGIAPTTASQVYNQLTGAGSAEKRFGNAFADFGGSVVAQIYDQTSATASQNNVVYTGTARGGFWMTPDIYGFVEGSGDSRDFDTSVISSNGYRVIAGVGTGRIGLVKGEVYAGYQAEMFRSSAIGTSGSPAFGGQLDYSPLPELDIKVGADRTIGASQLSATTGTSTTVTDVLAVVSYALAPEWSASGRAGYIRTGYKGVNRTDNSWTVGPTLTYSVWRNFGLTLDYQHIGTTSNAALVSFSRDIVTVGASYKY